MNTTKTQSPTAQYFSQWKQMTCPSCKDTYTLGVNGTVHGCDRCEGVIRNPVDHSIIDDPFGEVFKDEERPS